MTSSVNSLCILGIILFTCITRVNNYRIDENHDEHHFHSREAFHNRGTRVKRNENKLNIESQSVTVPEMKTSSHPDVPSSPYWMADLLAERWYGWEAYQKRKLFTDDPTKKPTVCYNNVTSDVNGTRLRHFICPLPSQDDVMVHCCRAAMEQRCCDTADGNNADNEDTGISDLDLATGIGIAAGFVSSVTICMLLYCCCCQSRPTGIKLMWVRRSFGKELNRLEQPTYNNHLAVISNSRAGSRTGSRAGSRSGSFRENRIPSRGPSPSVSRRQSFEPSPRNSRKRNKSPLSPTAHSKQQYMKVPNDVTITLTTPSDENGPTNPLLHTEKHTEGIRTNHV